MSVDTRQPIASIPRGISGGGPTSVTCAPINTSAWMFERATRECRTSPTIATCSPSIRPSSSSIVYRSSRACVGCWCLPSPALTTCAPVSEVPSNRTTSSRVRSAIEIRCRRGGAGGGSSSPMTWISALAMGLFFSLLDQQHPVDLVDLEELYLDALVAPRGQVLADVVGSDRQLAMATVWRHGELDAGRAAVVEEGLDRGADRPARVEDVVDEDAGLPLEREVEACRADDRLRMERRVAPADGDVVPVERDVDGAELDPGARGVLDQATGALGQRRPP